MSKCEKTQWCNYDFSKGKIFSIHGRVISYISTSWSTLEYFPSPLLEYKSAAVYSRQVIRVSWPSSGQSPKMKNNKDNNRPWFSQGSSEIFWSDFFTCHMLILQCHLSDGKSFIPLWRILLDGKLYREQKWVWPEKTIKPAAMPQLVPSRGTCIHCTWSSSTGWCFPEISAVL